MSEEKKIAPLSEDELGKVAGGVIAYSTGANPQSVEVIMNSVGAKPTCPACGAETSLDPATGKLTCPTCGWKNG